MVGRVYSVLLADSETLMFGQIWSCVIKNMTLQSPARIGSILQSCSVHCIRKLGTRIDLLSATISKLSLNVISPMSLLYLDID